MQRACRSQFRSDDGGILPVLERFPLVRGRPRWQYERPVFKYALPPLMAFDWVIDSRKKLIIVSGEGEFTFAEVWDYLAAIAGANALTYRQLLDLSQAFTELTPAEAMELGVRMRMQHGQSVPGPVAVVMPRRQSDSVARLLGIMATAERPMRLFNEFEAAQQWIDTLVRTPSADEKPRV